MIDDRTVLADRITSVLVLAELMLEGAYGPLTLEQETVLIDMVESGKEVRDIVRRNPYIID